MISPVPTSISLTLKTDLSGKGIGAQEKVDKGDTESANAYPD